MARPKNLICEAAAVRARAQIRRIHDHQLCVRLKAIMSCYDHPKSLVASVFGITPATLRRWVRNFEQAGLDGLRDRPKGHRLAKLTREQQYEVKWWLEDGVNSRVERVDWTLEKLSAEIQKNFGVSLSATPLRRWIRVWGLRPEDVLEFSAPHKLLRPRDLLRKQHR